MKSADLIFERSYKSVCTVDNDMEHLSSYTVASDVRTGDVAIVPVKDMHVNKKLKGSKSRWLDGCATGLFKKAAIALSESLSLIYSFMSIPEMSAPWAQDYFETATNS